MRRCCEDDFCDNSETSNSIDWVTGDRRLANSVIGAIDGVGYAHHFQALTESAIVRGAVCAQPVQYIGHLIAVILIDYK